MKGYKGMDKNMQCLGMQYEVGKTYHVDGEIDVCRNGLHFCEKLKDVFNYYERDGNRFYEVEASGTIKSDGNKSATSDLRIIRELSDVEINRISYGCGYNYGYSYSNSNGCGNGNGHSNGNGCGNGYNYGYGCDYNCGNGYGCGYNYGYSDGDGDGYGYGNGIQRILIFT